MFKRIGDNKYDYNITDEDLKYLNNFMAFTALFTKDRKQYAPAKNLTLEYIAMETFVVDKFLSEYDLENSAIINVTGKYMMEIYIKRSKELEGITHSAIIV